MGHFENGSQGLCPLSQLRAISSDEWSNLEQFRKKFKTFFYSNQFFYTRKISKNLELFFILRTTHKHFFQKSSSRGVT